MLSVAIIIVTYNSQKSIISLLDNLLGQTLLADHIIVIDNNSSDNTVQLIRNINHPNIKIVQLQTNIGGAGGFAKGFNEAMKFTPEVIFSFDDDAFPSNKNFIADMIAIKHQYQLDVVAPLVINPDNHQASSYVYRWHNQHSSKVIDIQSNPVIEGDIKLFNGVLFDKHVIAHLKGPKPEFFIRGDEQEFRVRIIEAGYKVAIATACMVYHPSSVDEYHYIKNKRYHHLDSPVKLYFSTRNRMYILRTREDFKIFKKFKIGYKEFWRYTWFYLIYRKADIINYHIWLRAFIAGLMKNMNNSVVNL